MTVLITLTLAGSDTGPFSIYSDTNGFTTPIITGISRTTLVAGYNANVPDGTTEVLVKSTGVCNRSLYLNIPGATSTSTTSSTSTTTTIAPPATSTLTFTSYKSGYFTFNLSNALSIPLTITGATVEGSNNKDCSQYEEGDDISDVIIIASGKTKGSIVGNSPMPCLVKAYVKSSSIDVLIAGTYYTVVNGDTITAGGTVITISIDTSCVAYAC
jgi:hypothetical protein